MLIKGFREVFIVRNALISSQDPSADDVVPKTLFTDMLRQVVRIPQLMTRLQQSYPAHVGT